MTEVPGDRDLTSDDLPAEAADMVHMWWTTDPSMIYPERRIGIRFGSSWIVDDVRIRDDVAAQIISKREGLRQRGYGNTEIERIMDELAAEQSLDLSAPVIASSLQAGSTVAAGTGRS